VEVVNPEREILPGMTANIFLHSANTSTGFPIIPIHAILEDKVTGAHFVWLVDEAGNLTITDHETGIMIYKDNVTDTLQPELIPEETF
jgi:hypothetical protein